MFCFGSVNGRFIRHKHPHAFNVALGVGLWGKWHGVGGLLFLLLTTTTIATYSGSRRQGNGRSTMCSNVLVIAGGARVPGVRAVSGGMHCRLARDGSNAVALAVPKVGFMDGVPTLAVIVPGLRFIGRANKIISRLGDAIAPVIPCVNDAPCPSCEVASFCNRVPPRALDVEFGYSTSVALPGNKGLVLSRSAGCAKALMGWVP